MDKISLFHGQKFAILEISGIKSMILSKRTIRTTSMSKITKIHSSVWKLKAKNLQNNYFGQKMTEFFNNKSVFLRIAHFVQSWRKRVMNSIENEALVETSKCLYHIYRSKTSLSTVMSFKLISNQYFVIKHVF